MTAIGKGVTPLSPLTIPTEAQPKKEVVTSPVSQTNPQNSPRESAPPPKSSTLAKFQHTLTYNDIPEELKLQVLAKMDGKDLARMRPMSRETTRLADVVDTDFKSLTGSGKIEQAKKNYFETEIMAIARSSSNLEEFKKKIDALFEKAGTSTPVKISIRDIGDSDQADYLLKVAKSTNITIKNSYFDRQERIGRAIAFDLIG